MHKQTYERLRKEHDCIIGTLWSASERVVVNLPGPKLSVRDRLFVEMYLTVGELEKIPEYSAAFTLEQYEFPFKLAPHSTPLQGIPAHYFSCGWAQGIGKRQCAN